MYPFVEELAGAIKSNPPSAPIVDAIAQLP